MNGAIEFLDHVVATDSSLARRAECFRQLLVFLLRRFLYSGTDSDLERAIKAGESAIALNPTLDNYTNNESVDLFMQLSSCYQSRFSRSRSDRDLDNLISVTNQALGIVQDNDPIKTTCLITLARGLNERYGRKQNHDDLNRAIEVQRIMLNVDPSAFSESQPRPMCINRIETLCSLGNLLGSRYDKYNSVSDLDEAIKYLSTAIEIVNVNSNNLQRLRDCRMFLAQMFYRRFRSSPQKNDIDRAIEECEMALLISSDSPRIQGVGIVLSFMLEDRYDSFKASNDLDRALELHRNRDKAIYSADLGTKLQHYERTNILLQKRSKQDDISDGIVICHQLLKSPLNHPRRFEYYASLGSWFYERACLTNSKEDWELTIDAHKNALELCLQPSAKRLKIINALTRVIVDRVRDFNRPKDLISLIDHIEQAIKPDQKEKIELDLIRLRIRFVAIRLNGDPGDIETAIGISKRIAALDLQDNPNVRDSLVDTAAILAQQYHKSESTDYLEHAVSISRRIFEKTPENSIDQSIYKANLACVLCTRYHRLGKLEDLIESTHLNEEALKLVEARLSEGLPQHPKKAETLQYQLWEVKFNLATCYGLLPTKDGDTSSKEQAIQYFIEALDLMTDDNPTRFRALQMLSSTYHLLFLETADEKHIRLALDAARKAVDTAPGTHPHRGYALYGAGSIYEVLYGLTSNPEHLKNAITTFEEGWNLTCTYPTTRLYCIISAGRLLANAQLWDRSYIHLKSAIRFLPSLNPRSLKNNDKEFIASTISGLSSMAAAVSLNANKGASEALSLLEGGREVIAGLVLQMRIDISDLKTKNPSLAEEFISLRNELDVAEEVDKEILSSAAPSWDWEQKSAQRSKASQRFNELVDKIHSLRTQTGFDLAPTQDELITASSSGPVIVININHRRCDAILIDARASESDHGPIWVKPLPDFDKDKVEESVLRLRESGVDADMLEWLWDVAAGPILDELGFNEPPPSNEDGWPHVYWVLTGMLNYLPIHAAGYHGTNRTVLDRVMSSYTSSVQSLVYGHRKLATEGISAPKESDNGTNLGKSFKALLVAMEQTPGGVLAPSRLEYATREVDIVAQLCREKRIEAIQPQATREKIQQGLERCNMFHFAGHGKTDPKDPSQSCILLEDWQTHPLTVADLRNNNLHEKSPFLAYLSACSTNLNLNSRLADEGIHLVNGFQLAGFRHVIGTLWEVSDEHCAEVAKNFYQTAINNGLTDKSVHLGLHKAVRALRDSYFNRTTQPAQQREVTISGGEADTLMLPGIIQIQIDESLSTKQDGEVEGQLTREERNVILAGAGDAAFDGHIRLWAPYIHVGI